VAFLENIIIRKIKLPPAVRGLTVLDNENNYNIYLNTANNIEIDQKAVEHEIKHIENEDFYSLEDVSKIEK